MDLKVMPRLQKGTQIYTMHYRRGNQLFNHSPYISSQNPEEEGEALIKKHYNKILYP